MDYKKIIKVKITNVFKPTSELSPNATQKKVTGNIFTYD